MAGRSCLAMEFYSFEAHTAFTDFPQRGSEWWYGDVYVFAYSPDMHRDSQPQLSPRAKELGCCQASHKRDGLPKSLSRMPTRLVRYAACGSRVSCYTGALPWIRLPVRSSQLPLPKRS